MKVRKRAKIRNRYNQAPHLTQDTNGKVTTLLLNKKKIGKFNNAEHINDHNCEPIQSNTTYKFDFVFTLMIIWVASKSFWRIVRSYKMCFFLPVVPHEK